MSGLDAIGGWIDGLVDLVSRPGFQAAALWLLAGVFAVSGWAKLRQPALAAFAIADFGVVRRPNPVQGIALGVVEVALALGLVGTSTTGGAAAAAIAGFGAILLWTFVVLIARSLLAGDRFECHCFGRGDAPLSGKTILRTAALAIVATVASVGLVDSASPDSSALVVYAVVGVGALSVCALASRMPNLLEWNDDPFGLQFERGLR